MDEEEIRAVFIKHSMEKNPELELFDTDAIIKDLAALIASYSREIQISDREVLIGMFEANKDNISVGEIIAILKGQVEAIEAEPEGKPNE